jgi:hypothetical protein
MQTGIAFSTREHGFAQWSTDGGAVMVIERAGVMTVGQLRQLLDGVDDKLEIVIRAWDDDNDYCGGISGAQVELAHDEDCSPYFAIDCCPDEDES